MKKGKARVNNRKDILYVSYEDTDVEFFGGHDYEVHYTLDKKSKKRLNEALAKKCKSKKLEDRITEYFGASLDNESFSSFCDGLGISYDLSTSVN